MKESSLSTLIPSFIYPFVAEIHSKKRKHGTNVAKVQKKQSNQIYTIVE